MLAFIIESPSLVQLSFAVLDTSIEMKIVDSSFTSKIEAASVAEWIGCSLVKRVAGFISQPALLCWQEGCPEGRPAVYTLIQCIPLLVEKAGVVPDVTPKTFHS